MPLLGTYFEQGTRPLHAQQGPSTENSTEPGEDTERLAAALRLRVALAAAGRLAEIAQAITAKPNFRYQRRRTETVGLVRGRLDVMRYLTGSHRLQQPPRYPVIETVRSQATPENTLLVCAAHWLLDELAQPGLTADLPDPGPERTATRAATSELRSLLTLPIFASCRATARDTMRHTDLGRLLSQVEQRLAAGHVLNRQPYRDLTDWVRGCLRGRPAAQPGDLDWSFYGDEFDPKLFELWCLTTLAEQIGAALGQPPIAPDLTRRSVAPLYRWHTALGDLEIYYQRAPSSHDCGWAASWAKDGSNALAGIPDISVIGRGDHGPNRLVLLDPKLRQRIGAPGDELYKMLGYFEQYGQHDEGQGAVLLYGSDDRAVSYTTRAGGHLLEATVNPTSGANPSGTAWTALTQLALKAVGLDTLAPMAHRPGVGDQAEDSPEAVAGRAQKRAVLTLQALAEQVGENALRPWRSQLETAFLRTWHRLDADAQEMCTTAVYLGNVLTEGRDFSGAVLGLCAAAETLLWQFILQPAFSVRPEVANQHMLGQMLATVDDAVSGRGGADSNADAVRTALHSAGIRDSDLQPVIAELKRVNVNYRRPAAHRDLLPRDDWLKCHRVMIAGTAPLLPRLADIVLP